MLLNLIIKRAAESSRKLKLQRGQGLVEYSLILTLVSVVVIVVLVVLGPAVGNIFSNIVMNI
jgi:pilus assembly protein Flp/PilA